MRSGAKTRYHHGALEQALVAEAVRQLRERGAEQVSLRGLAQTVGVSPSAAYQHFPDKAALMAAVCLAAGDELAVRMRAAVAEATAAAGGNEDVAAVGRLLAVGRAYVDFSVAEPHLFRHMFGTAAPPGPHMAPAGEGSGEPGGPGTGNTGSTGSTSGADGEDDGPDDSYRILLEQLAEVSERGLLRPGIAVAEGSGVDVLAWSAVHGLSSLVVDGHLPAEARDLVLGLFGRLILTDEAFMAFAATLPAPLLAAPPALSVPEAAGGR